MANIHMSVSNVNGASNAGVSNTSVPSLISSKDISSHRQQKFNEVLDRKKDEFLNLLGNKPPSSIDFSDKMDKPIGSEIEDMLAATIARRNNDLNIVLDKQDTSSAAKWINANNGAGAGASISAGAGASTSAGAGTPPINIIKIGQNTTLDNTSVIDISQPQKQKKQVRFNETTTIQTNENSYTDDSVYGLAELEKQDDDDDDISTFLSILNQKQNDIADAGAGAIADADAGAGAIADAGASSNNIPNNKSLLFEMETLLDKFKMLFEERLNKIDENQKIILELLQNNMKKSNEMDANNK